MRTLTAIVLAGLGAASSHAERLGMAMTQLPQGDGGSITVFYPTRAAESAASVGPFRLSWAGDAAPAKGNGRLVVVSHGSGGAPWVHADLARTLVGRGFVVALPQHAGDNARDPSTPGPESWVKRPREVSGAIDRVGADPRFAPLLALDAVGVFGGSAGGHTALTLAGGEWSPARFRDHCMRHMEDDFSSCVGFTTLLGGDWLDGVKRWLARRVIAWRFSDDTPQRHVDARVKAVIAMVPFAADFDPSTLASPKVPLGLVIADKDVNQVPAFHVERIRQACEPRCEVMMRLADGSHGAMLSPLPPLEKGSIAEHLLADPPGFDRAGTLPLLNGRIADFFEKLLLPH
ncbi:dienelactone hydrolase [Schlegelella sp. ID0723]|uniref:Dienelactone hydrolase n=2 Tax=Piscinibacter koreensis TaxID=2742824 RepID=A0A7Y6NLI2_9BURK|nr:dienelactone hydrolase [Schlegelella koreensis]